MFEEYYPPEENRVGLERDLHNSEVILEKVKDDEYAQKLYAALCNTDWVRDDVIPMIRQGDDDKWSCSWRASGRIVAQLRNDGDYLDWYCSGMSSGMDYVQEQKTTVSEGIIDPEIRKDILEQCGWIGIQIDK